MQTETLKIAGMTCNGCTSKVAHALNAIPGVHEVVVNLAPGEAAVRYDEHLATSAQLKTAVKEAGYSVDLPAAAQSQQSKGGCCG